MKAIVQTEVRSTKVINLSEDDLEELVRKSLADKFPNHVIEVSFEQGRSGVEAIFTATERQASEEVKEL
jgi:hypothetical protein